MYRIIPDGAESVAATLKGVHTIEVVVSDSLPSGVLSAVIPAAGGDGVAMVILAAAELGSRVDRHEDEHGEFYVFRCTDGNAGREWADPDEAELERLAHDDATHPGQAATVVVSRLSGRTWCLADTNGGAR